MVSGGLVASGGPEGGGGPGERRGRPNGFALAAVLWVMVLVGALSATFLAAARSERRATLRADEEVRARWAARAGLARAISALDASLSSPAGATPLAPRPGGGDTLMGPVAFRMDGLPVRAVLLDARARLDLNAADGETLERLLAAAGLPPEQRRPLVAAILDWRDADRVRRENGAEASDYVALGASRLPADGPFGSADDLGAVRGVTPALLRRLLPLVTVSGDGRIDVNAAPAPVLATLPGLGPAAAVRLAAFRRRELFEDPYGVLRALEPGQRKRLQENLDAFRKRAAFGPRSVELRVEAGRAGTPSFAMVRAEVELAGGRAWQVRGVVER